ncbi:hypothetical protein B0H16DRAFT_1745937 [Mycena metata]|uniref:F-box domain-containing protein n=1 Tax=Mycena metata TaxID=1033252 RepID=A0AAD7H083_9AGAR|nr:hypothetical protein B0H16DRAFT_1745937 [Mycena metata]
MSVVRNSLNKDYNLNQVLSSLPKPVWTAIFGMVLQHGVGCYRLAFRLRNVLLHVCKFWRCIVKNAAAFWTRVHLKTTTSVDLATTILESSRDLPLEVRVDFRGSRVHGICEDMDALLHLISAHMCRTRTITAILDSDPSRRCFQQSLLFARLPQLSGFTVTRGSISGHLRPSPCVLTWVPEYSRSLSLRLQNVSFAWIAKGDFAHLRTLVLRDMSYDRAPTWADFSTLFVVATGLQQLSLRAVGCSGLPLLRHGTPVMKRLMELDLCFGNDTSFEHAMRLLRLPCLRTFKFTAFTSEEFDAIGRCSASLARVTTFIIDGTFDEHYKLSRIFLNMPSLANLELLSNGSTATAALLACDKWLTVTFGTQSLGCPDLSVLAVPDSPESWDIAASFVKRRYSRGGMLSQVVFGETRAYWCIYDVNVITMQPVENTSRGPVYVRYGEPRWLRDGY